MITYNVKRDLHQNGRIFRKGGTIELSERQARHLLINGFIEKPAEKKPATKSQAKASEKK